jgi:acetyl esterase/lipase
MIATRLSSGYVPEMLVRCKEPLIIQTVENCHKIGGDVEKGFIVCGASAGANLAAAVTHRSLKDPFFKDRRITGNVLQIPVLVHPAAYPPQSALFS